MTRLTPLMPEEARMYVVGLCALRNSGLRFEDEHWKLWEEENAFRAWCAALDRARGCVTVKARHPEVPERSEGLEG